MLATGRLGQMDLTLTAAAIAVHPVHHSTTANPLLLVLAGLVGGFAVGLTGMGGGALMTSALVLLFKVEPKVAVASDLVNSLVMKPIGGGVHLRRGTVHWRLVGWMVVGSVPSAFFGAFLLNQLGDSKAVQTQIKALLGWALLVASVAIIAKAVLTVRANRRLAALGQQPNIEPHAIKPVSSMLTRTRGWRCRGSAVPPTQRGRTDPAPLRRGQLIAVALLLTCAWPGGAWGEAASPAPARSWARPRTWPPSRRGAARTSLPPPTSTLWGPSSTSASPAALPSSPTQ